MTEKWLEILLSVPVAAADLLCYELHRLGSVGVVVEERALDTFIPPDPDETDSERFSVKAYFDDSKSPEKVLTDVRQSLVDLSPMFPELAETTVSTSELGQQDWAEGWKQHFTATHIGSRLVIKPSWEEYQASLNEVVVTLDPGMAFGTGTHGTTRLCLETLATLFDGDVVPCRVLDVGTGSGILAIAAAALGAQQVVACDIDPVACTTASDNIAGNGYSDTVEVTGALLEDLEGEYDVVLANILAEENIRLAQPLLDRLSAGGTLILSGILQEKVSMVTDAFAALGLPESTLFFEQEWACIQYCTAG
ncbi:MAG: 50S ribosomal protein L11 methyltransferase [Desulfuromonas sp.]|nr:50S ribosomal protein L11 methyltransferase [Desulfuromonas sp.]